jgi:putative Mg2+ transporter-C (MgtC) family protein
MTTEFTWLDAVARLGVGCVAGGLLGFDRSEHGRPAGLRTTLLVCLAAVAAMILANLLLPTAGKRPDGFAAMDVMRLPLGILTGVGFIGAGAVLHRSNFVLGVTTAATLWFATVMGLCIGGGEIGLGLALLALGLFILWALKYLELLCDQNRLAELAIDADAPGLSPEALVERLRTAQFRVRRLVMSTSASGRKYRCEVEWRGKPDDVGPPGIVRELSADASVRRVRWTPRR